jgi:hypothetical protein
VVFPAEVKARELAKFLTYKKEGASNAQAETKSLFSALRKKMRNRYHDLVARSGRSDNNDRDNTASFGARKSACAG